MKTMQELREAIGRAVGAIAPDPDAEAGRAEKAKDKFTIVPNREMMRRITGGKHVPASEFRPGTVEHSMAAKHQRKRRTGAPKHVVAWRHADAVKKHLKGLRTASLAQGIEDKAVASAFGLLVDFTPTVWDIARSNKAALLAVPGMGPVNLKRVHGYLTGHQVELSWSA